MSDSPIDVIEAAIRSALTSYRAGRRPGLQLEVRTGSSSARSAYTSVQGILLKLPAQSGYEIVKRQT